MKVYLTRDADKNSLVELWVREPVFDMKSEYFYIGGRTNFFPYGKFLKSTGIKIDPLDMYVCEMILVPGGLTFKVLEEYTFKD